MSRGSAGVARRNPGNLYGRGETWWIRYGVNGRKVRRSLGTRSLREARRMRDQILAKRSAAARFGIETPHAEPCKTFAEIGELWLQSRLADDSLATSTREQNARLVRNILVPRFGVMAMSAISADDVERFIAELRTTRARATVAQYYCNLSSIIRQAIRRGWFAGPNPLDRLDRPPTQGPGRDVMLTADEARRLLAELTGRLYYKVALALQTGLRWGEIHGLAWADLALDASQPALTVRRSYRDKPKTEASAATIPLGVEAAALARRWHAEQAGPGQPGGLWVFPGRYGQLLARPAENERRAIHEASARAGIARRVTPHVFRHTFGTWLYEQTGDPKIVQRLMRHASFHTSMLYVHDRRDLGGVVGSDHVVATGRGLDIWLIQPGHGMGTRRQRRGLIKRNDQA